MSLTISVPGPQECFQKIGQTIKDSGKQRRILGEEQIDRGQIFFARDEFLDHHRGLLKHHRASGQLGKKSTSWKKKILAGPAKLEKKRFWQDPPGAGGGGFRWQMDPKMVSKPGARKYSSWRKFYSGDLFRISRSPCPEKWPREFSTPSPGLQELN